MNPITFTTGGTVQAGGGFYLARQADADLLQLCREGRFAYILTARQMGKSSLMVRTAEELTRQNIRAVMIDLTQIGTQVTPDQWYLGLLAMIEEQLLLSTDAVAWWQTHAHLGLTQRLTKFLQEVLLREITDPVVIFVDEIDTTLSLDFTDDFFAAIRSYYNARATAPEFARLSFVLIGVATPGDLIRDPQRTPFNIGQRVDLADFTRAEAQPLADGLQLPATEAARVLDRVLHWTSGHPYLTQRLCQTLADERRSHWTHDDVDRAVERTFFGAMSEQDNNLQFVRDMLTKRAEDAEGVLKTYRAVRNGQRIPDDAQSLNKSLLKLSGLLRLEGNYLRVSNLLYQIVFDEEWVEKYLKLINDSDKEFLVNAIGLAYKKSRELHKEALKKVMIFRSLMYLTLVLASLLIVSGSRWVLSGIFDRGMYFIAVGIGFLIVSVILFKGKGQIFQIVQKLQNQMDEIEGHLTLLPLVDTLETQEGRIESRKKALDIIFPEYRK